uniref:Uncharacterized protein n=1 Tax=Theropithecus gelada TaxID=9565 RepID=A0A8D2GAS3_THEGE
MLLSPVVHMYSPALGVMLLGMVLTHVLAWGVWQLPSIIPSANFFQAVDSWLYCVYQSVVLFENYTTVQILLHGSLPKIKKNIMYLANRQSTVDWIVTNILAIEPNALVPMCSVLKD